MEFRNNFSATFLEDLPRTKPTKSRRSKTGVSEDVIEFENGFQNRLFSAGPDTIQSTPTTFSSGFSPKLEDDGIKLYPEEHQGGQASKKNSFEHLRFVVRRRTLSNATQICDPLNDEVIYSVNQPCPSKLEVLRTVSGDAPVGTVHYGHFSDKIRSAATGQSYNNIQDFKLCTLPEQTQASRLVWKVKLCTERPKTHILSDGSAQVEVTQPLVTLELVDRDRQNGESFCTVSMYTIRPIGLIEIHAQSACINHDGGDWAILDEIILSAYANMEKARQRLFRGMRPDASGFLGVSTFSWG